MIINGSDYYHPGFPWIIPLTGGPPLARCRAVTRRIFFAIRGVPSVEKSVSLLGFLTRVCLKTGYTPENGGFHMENGWKGWFIHGFSYGKCSFTMLQLDFAGFIHAFSKQTHNALTSSKFSPHAEARVIGVRVTAYCPLQSSHLKADPWVITREHPTEIPGWYPLVMTTSVLVKIAIYREGAPQIWWFPIVMQTFTRG